MGTHSVKREHPPIDDATIAAEKTRADLSRKSDREIQELILLELRRLNGSI